MGSKQKALAILGLLSGAVTWGLIWYPYRLLERQGISGELASFITYSVALVLGAVFLFGPLRQIRKAPPILLWIGLTAGWANLAYVLAVIHGEVMRVLLLFYLAPLWTVMFSRFLLGERLNLYGYLVILLSLGGAVVMLWRPESGWPMPRNQAEWLGLSAGFMFALTNVLARRAQDLDIRVKSLTVWAGVSLLSLVPLLYRPVRLDVALTPSSAMLLLAVGLVLYVVTLTVQFGLTHTPANQAIVIFLFELVVAAASAYLLAHEAMSLQEWVGGAMIVAASLFSGRLAQNG